MGCLGALPAAWVSRVLAALSLTRPHFICVGPGSTPRCPSGTPSMSPQKKCPAATTQPKLPLRHTDIYCRITQNKTTINEIVYTIRFADKFTNYVYTLIIGFNERTT